MLMMNIFNLFVDINKTSPRTDQWTTETSGSPSRFTVARGTPTKRGIF